MPSVGRAFRRLVERLACRLHGERPMLSRMTVEQFAEALAAATPTPGGGSASAQAGAMAASLIQMMCDLTLGPEQYPAHPQAVQGIKHPAEGLPEDPLGPVGKD